MTDLAETRRHAAIDARERDLKATIPRPRLRDRRPGARADRPRL